MSSEEAGVQLAAESRAVLAVLARYGGRPIPTLHVTSRKYRGRVGIVCEASVNATGEGRIDVDSALERRIIEQVRWAEEDVIYRELLELRIEAYRADNPRRDVWKMLERLEESVRPGNRHAVYRRFALDRQRTDGLLRAQARYQGDRHADHPRGTELVPIPHATRAEVLRLAEDFLAAYERVALRGQDAGDAVHAGR